MSDERLSPAEILIASWGVIGVLALVGQALYRLTPLALVPLQQDMLNGWLLALYIFWAVFNGYAEGYRGFQRAFSPRVVARAFYLARNPKPTHVILAPLFCMAMFHASRKRLYVAWGLFIGIVIVIIIIRQLAQPWRGIVDVGVVVGLAWGALSIIVLFLRALITNEVPPDDSLPDHASQHS